MRLFVSASGMSLRGMSLSSLDAHNIVDVMVSTSAHGKRKTSLCTGIVQLLQAPWDVNYDDDPVHLLVALRESRGAEFSSGFVAFMGQKGLSVKSVGPLSLGYNQGLPHVPVRFLPVPELSCHGDSKCDGKWEKQLMARPRSLGLARDFIKQFCRHVLEISILS